MVSQKSTYLHVSTLFSQFSLAPPTYSEAMLCEGGAIQASLAHLYGRFHTDGINDVCAGLVLIYINDNRLCRRRRKGGTLL